ncbi:hypothetical protein H6G96_06430 [Nostoc sp. FACHB-892]|uniref:hypothetical protein n=1 Tax=Nostoc sp. FACHB-892 TaxID=2692843 RepID=UPI001687F5B9|nr:hypothetical protein [Nostoc sp. FACHB-892]MBD2725967.1 hypothetical protein [Nostoc sp. FACHB-892]
MKKNEKLHLQRDGVFGHGEEVTNALCPKATGRLSLSTHVRVASRREGMEFPVAFDELS